MIGRDHVLLARNLGCICIGLEQGRVVPAAYLMEIIAASTIFLAGRITLKSLQDRVDVFLDHLELVGDGNAIAVIIDGDDSRRPKNADRID